MTNQFLPLLTILAVILTTTGCSAKRIGLNRMADALSATAAGYGKDNDPEFVRLAAPATLKMVEKRLQ